MISPRMRSGNSWTSGTSCAAGRRRRQWQAEDRRTGHCEQPPRISPKRAWVLPLESVNHPRVRLSPQAHHSRDGRRPSRSDSGRERLCHAAAHTGRGAVHGSTRTVSITTLSSRMSLNALVEIFGRVWTAGLSSPRPHPGSRAQPSISAAFRGRRPLRLGTVFAPARRREGSRPREARAVGSTARRQAPTPWPLLRTGDCPG